MGFLCSLNSLQGGVLILDVSPVGNDAITALKRAQAGCSDVGWRREQNIGRGGRPFASQGWEGQLSPPSCRNAPSQGCHPGHRLGIQRVLKSVALLRSSPSQSMTQGTAATASAGSWLEMQSLGPTSHPQRPNPWRWDPGICILQASSLDAYKSLKITALHTCSAKI